MEEKSRFVCAKKGGIFFRCSVAMMHRENPTRRILVRIHAPSAENDRVKIRQPHRTHPAW
jgi:hypothetical protein